MPRISTPSIYHDTHLPTPDSDSCSHDIAVDDLGQANVAAVGVDVEGLGLDVGTAHDLPLQIILDELGVGRVLGLHRNRLQAFGSIVVVRESHAVGVLSVLAGRQTRGSKEESRLFHPRQHVGFEGEFVALDVERRCNVMLESQVLGRCGELA